MKTTTLPVTDRAQRVLQTAEAERRRLGHPVLTPQHILWALLAEKGSVATQVLSELHFDVATLEKRLGPDWQATGPAGTLATFLKYGLPATTTSTVHSILTPFGVDQKNLAAVVASIAA